MEGRSLNLYKLSQSVNNGYDTYDSCIVAAKNEEQAREIPPHKHIENDKTLALDYWAKPEDVKVEFIGAAKRGTKKGVILASFNAG